MEERVERKNRRRGCLLAALGCTGVSLLAALVLFAVFTVNNRTPAIHIPTPKMPKPNAWGDFVRASTMIRVPPPLATLKPPGTWTNAEYERFMRADAAALALVRAGLRKPFRNPPIVSTYAVPYTEYSGFRELARTLAGESMYYERRGDYGRAMDSRLDCIEFGAILPRGGALITGLVGVAVDAIGADKIGRILPKLTPAELARSAARMRRVQSRKIGCAEVFRGEADLTAIGVREILRDKKLQQRVRDPLSWVTEKDPFGLYVDPLFGTLKPPKVSTARRIWDNASFALGNKTKMVNEIRDYWLALAKEVNGPCTGKFTARPPDSLIGELLVNCLGPVPSRAHAAFARGDALLALIETEIALRRYRAERGRYPARLGQLVPRYLKRLERDPFSTKPLRYKVLKGGAEFLLYSIGFDLADNGGVGSQRISGGTGDIVLDRK